MSKSIRYCGSVLAMMLAAALCERAYSQQESAVPPAGQEQEEPGLVIVDEPVQEAEPDLLQDADRRRRIQTQRVRFDVENNMRQVSRTFALDPDTAIADLKRDLQMVLEADIDADVKAELARRLRTAILESQRRQQELELEVIARQKLIASGEARRRAVEQLQNDQQRLEQLMEQFRALMIEERYTEAEVVARRTEADYNDQAVPKQAVEVSEAKGNLAHMMALRFLRQDRVVETLALAEDSMISMPDEPPIVYPRPEVWENLSKRRIERYYSVGLEATSESERLAERNIRRALEQSGNFDFPDTPLEVIARYIQDEYGINVRIHQSIVEGEGSDVEIDYTAHGISLKSALKSMLESIEATYWIENESLYIGTKEASEENIKMRVYEVGDLVIPVGAGGGLGGGGGGLGGGLGGGGGGGLGGGGGVLNVPANLLRNNAPAGTLDFQKMMDRVAPRAGGGQVHLQVRDGIAGSKQTEGDQVAGRQRAEVARPF